MNNEQETDIKLGEALDIVEAGRDISDEQLQRLLADDELQADVQLALEAGAGLRAARRPVDVEARLKAFHAEHDRQPHAAYRYLWPLLAAAVLAGFIYLLRPAHQEETATPQTILFTADAHQEGLQLTNEQGETVALSAKTRQYTSVTLADFRRVLSEAETERVTLSVPNGKSTDITLPDGSVAYLHPGARLVFPTAFIGKERAVVLEGEAYFKVAHDAAHPFVVMAGDIETTVLGTEFNVDSRSGSVTLINGSVRVSSDGHNVMLKPHEQYAEGTVREVDTTPYEMWRDGYLYFDNVELHDIMLAIGQNFNMTVEFRDTTALHLKMRFMADRNNGVDAAVQMMNHMKKATISRHSDRLVVE